MKTKEFQVLVIIMLMCLIYLILGIGFGIVITLSKLNPYLIIFLTMCFYTFLIYKILKIQKYYKLLKV